MAGGMGIQVFAHIAAIAGISDTPFDPLAPDMDSIQPDFPVINRTRGHRCGMPFPPPRVTATAWAALWNAPSPVFPPGWENHVRRRGESNCPNRLRRPAVKGVEFGAGFSAANLRGSQNNDDYVISDGQIRTVTNNAGGILGGITTGMPLIFRAALKPTPSISAPAERRSERWKVHELIVKGRPRPVHRPQSRSGDRAAAAIAIFDMILGNTQTDRRKP